MLTCVLLIGSAAALWWSWGPWGIANTIIYDGKIQTAQFIHDGKWILIHSTLPDTKASYQIDEVITIRDAASGKIVHQCCVESFHGNELVYSSPGGNYIALLSRDGVPRFKCWKADNGASIDFPKSARPEFALNLTFSPTDRFALLHHGDHIALIRMADLTETVSIKTEWPPHFLQGDKQVAFYNGEEIRVIDTETGQIEARHPIPKLSYPSIIISKSGKLLVADRVKLSASKGSGDKVVLYDVAAGQVLFDKPEKHLGLFELDDGMWMYTYGKDEDDGKSKAWVRHLFTVDPPIKIEAEENCGVAGGYVCQLSPFRILDAKTGRKLWQSNQYDEIWIGYHEYAFALKSHKLIRMVDIRNGNVLFDFESIARRPFATSASTNAEWAPNGVDFLTYDRSQHQVFIWKLTRPAQWYGPACLPEFWLTTFFAAAFIWSLTRPTHPRRNQMANEKWQMDTGK